jgi:hypothetical protein
VRYARLRSRSASGPEMISGRASGYAFRIQPQTAADFLDGIGCRRIRGPHGPTALEQARALLNHIGQQLGPPSGGETGAGCPRRVNLSVWAWGLCADRGASGYGFAFWESPSVAQTAQDRATSTLGISLYGRIPQSRSRWQRHRGGHPNGEPPRRQPLEPAPARADRSPALCAEELVRWLPSKPQLDAVLRGAQGTVSGIALVYHAAYLEAYGRSAPYGPIPLEIRPGRPRARVPGPGDPDHEFCVFWPPISRKRSCTCRRPSTAATRFPCGNCSR